MAKQARADATKRNLQDYFTPIGVLRSNSLFKLVVTGDFPQPHETIVGLGSADKIYSYFPLPCRLGGEYAIRLKNSDIVVWQLKDSPVELNFTSDIPASEATIINRQFETMAAATYKSPQFDFLPMTSQELFYLARSVEFQGNDTRLGFDAGGIFNQKYPEASVGEFRRPSATGVGELPKCSAAIVAHIYYPEIFDEIASFLEPYLNSFQVFITTCTEFALSDNDIVRCLPGVQISRYPNLGHDVGPFIDLLTSGKLDQYQLICKVHGKRSVKNGFATLLGDSWRRRSFLELLGSNEQVNKIATMFALNPAIGMVGPRGLLFPRANFGAGVDGQDFISSLTQRLGIDSLDLVNQFFAGSMFWARTEALAGLKSLNLEIHDFQPAHSHDNLLSHAMERAFGFSAINDGFLLAETPQFNKAKATEVTTTALTVLKNEALTQDIPTCIFVALSRDNRISPDVYYYCDALVKQGFQLVFVAVHPQDNSNVKIEYPELFRKVLLRANEGHDFGAVAATLRKFPEMFETASLLIANDSVVGPLVDLTDTMTRIRASSSDFIGMVDTEEEEYHLQSWFLHFGKTALQNNAFKRFWARVVNQPTRAQVIFNYEVPLTSFLTSAGLKGEALFSVKSQDPVNPTMKRWRELIALGMPFVKRSLLNSADAELSASVLEIIKKAGVPYEF